MNDTPFVRILAEYSPGYYEDESFWSCEIFPGNVGYVWHITEQHSAGIRELEDVHSITIPSATIRDFFGLEAKYSCDCTSQESERLVIRLQSGSHLCEVYGRALLENRGTVIQPFRRIWIPIAEHVRRLL
jgi:hypothetical protein